MGKNPREDLEDAEPPRKRRVFTRKGAPKVKSGCRTCRRRKIKCDEGKPNCARCLKAEIVCEGYEKKHNHQDSRVARPILPKVQERLIIPSTVVTELSPGAASQNEPEWRYFRYFCDNMVDSLTGPTGTGLWRRSIPQAGEMQSWVRDITVALGALGLSQTTKAASSCELRRMKQVHESYAMIKYGQALTHMQEAVNNRVVDTRQIFLISVLVFCFEAMQGRKDTACINAAKGLRAIADLHLRAKQRADGSALQAYPKRHSDEDLACAEWVLDTQLLHFYDPRSASEHQAILQELDILVAGMPKQFDQSCDVYCFWSVMFRRNSHFVAAARAQVSDIDPRVGAFPVDWNDGFKYWLHVSPRSISSVPSSLLDDLARMLVDLENFRTASAMIMAEHAAVPAADARGKTFKSYYAQHVIHVQIAINRIQFASCFYPSPIIWDDYLHVFQDIVDRTPILIPYLVLKRSPAHPSQEVGFSFHFLVSILIALATVVNLCRAQPIRDQALGLLARIFTEANDYKEGICEIRIIYWLAKAIRDWEEAERDEMGMIPEDRRLTFAEDLDVGPKVVVCKLWRGYGKERTLVVRKYEHHLGDEGFDGPSECRVQEKCQIHLRS